VKFNRFVLVSLAAAALLSGCGKSTSPTGVTSNNLDTTPPPTPDGMTVVVDSNSGRQQLVWSPSSAADLARYQVYIYSPDPSRDNSFVLAGETDAHTSTFYLPVVNRTTSFVYRVGALDQSGNRSALSSPYQAQVRPWAGGVPGEPPLGTMTP